jgi:phospholipase/lecithinase/hemolysin
MRKLIALFVLAIPMAAQADYVDVIAAKMTGACSMAKYLQIVKDFDEQWGKSHNYKVEILVPQQSADVHTFYWVGRAANAEAFGRGLDAWNAAQADPNSAPSKLMARFRECSTNSSRGGFMTY